jgi:hypothetical protein
MNLLDGKKRVDSHLAGGGGARGGGGRAEERPGGCGACPPDDGCSAGREDGLLFVSYKPMDSITFHPFMQQVIDRRRAMPRKSIISTTDGVVPPRGTWEESVERGFRFLLLCFLVCSHLAFITTQ